MYIYRMAGDDLEEQASWQAGQPFAPHLLSANSSPPMSSANSQLSRTYSHPSRTNTPSASHPPHSPQSEESGATSQGSMCDMTHSSSQTSDSTTEALRNDTEVERETHTQHTHTHMQRQKMSTLNLRQSVCDITHSAESLCGVPHSLETSECAATTYSRTATHCNTLQHSAIRTTQTYSLTQGEGRWSPEREKERERERGDVHSKPMLDEHIFKVVSLQDIPPHSSSVGSLVGGGREVRRGRGRESGREWGERDIQREQESDRKREKDEAHTLTPAHTHTHGVSVAGDERERLVYTTHTHTHATSGSAAGARGSDSERGSERESERKSARARARARVPVRKCSTVRTPPSP